MVGGKAGVGDGQAGQDGAEFGKHAPGIGEGEVAAGVAGGRNTGSASLTETLRSRAGVTTGTPRSRAGATINRGRVFGEEAGA